MQRESQRRRNLKNLLKKGNQSAEMTAFKNSMKDYQEEFYQKVSLKIGVFEIWTKRFRWSRKEYA